ncbi:hypothetical protein D9613_006423 [Agrocybe pediades]|uniref:HAT C-terminal dimerisation domain-containing protein n=1 Tax=Agrocybe pediades TaxID=84607 RepID=A0A8H4QUR4_9AGAR|nr:hypothetical protein D9613_006402 [Agrocybe pediades]KAF4617428.1 hypothetical protein D9613_006403 [Agrocybe pediades]KAF4617566.1 hypothetical protein D9613_006423 [Agrocybe pediades]
MYCRLDFGNGIQDISLLEGRYKYPGFYICGICKKPGPACSCHPSYLSRPPAPPQFWPHSQASTSSLPLSHYQTPQRVPHTQYPHPSSLAYPPLMPMYAYPSQHTVFQHQQMQSSHFGRPLSNLQPVTPSRPPLASSSMDARLMATPIQETPAATSRTVKRKRTDGAKAPSKRPRCNPPSTNSANDENSDVFSVPGVGPSSERQGPGPASLPKPIVDYNPVTKKKGQNKAVSKQSATDVWYFVRPLDTQERQYGPIMDTQPTPTKPKSPFVGCRLCLRSSAWTVWKNSNGMADTIRNHLSSKHGTEWRQIVLVEQLKGWEKISSIKPVPKEVKEEFTLQGFWDRLARWIAVDDQSLNVVECPELRDLLLYLNFDLTDRDIPHRTKLTQLIFESYHREWKKLVSDLQNSEGRISFTSDLWSDPNLRSFMAVTAHFLLKDEHTNLVTKNRLVAFRHISGSHSGKHLAEQFLLILKELGIAHKIGMITLDNASNCGSMMKDLEDLLEKMGLQFSAEGNRIRCFPHVINIAVKAGLRALSASAPDITEEDEVPVVYEQNDGDAEYEDALHNDVVAKCRSLVTACRASGQRREDLQKTITEGNEREYFPKHISNKELLRDMDIRWSSTFLMIDRVLELYPAIDGLLSKAKYIDINHHLLDETELQVLTDIANFLRIPHAVQTVLCGEKTPTLPHVLPAYEDLLEMLRYFKLKNPQLKAAVAVTILKIEEYVKKSRKTRVYALATVIHPATKLDWIEEHWTQSEYRAAKEWMLQSMFEHRKASRKRTASSSGPRATGNTSQNTSSRARSEQSLSTGLAHIRTLKENLKRSASQVLPGPSSTPSLGSLNTGTQSTREDGEGCHAGEESGAETRADEKDKKAVVDELQRYLDEGLVTGDELSGLSLTRFWQYQFPALYHVALDILTVQASSVPCERAFSSSKETVTMRRNCLSTELMEVLQFLKYTYRQDRLDLMDGLLSTEEELLRADSVSSISKEEIRDLLAKGQIDQLIVALQQDQSSTTHPSSSN